MKNNLKLLSSIIPDSRPSRDEWMKEFKVSSQYYELQTLELVLRDEIISEVRKKQTANPNNLFGTKF